MQQPTCIIIGAGASALMAARQIAPHFKVIILEALPHIGGRIQTVVQEGDIIEAGPAFVHGNLPITLSLLGEAGINYVAATGNMYRKKESKFAPVSEMTEGWDALLDKMSKITDDITMQQLLKKYYSAPRYESLRRHVASYTEGFDLADMEKVSVKALYQEWSSADENIFRLPGGYAQLVEYLRQQLLLVNVNIVTGAIVSQVNWKRGSVTVQTLNGDRFEADKLLVTVPVSVLQQAAGKASIQFHPAIHFNSADANQVGFGAVIKVVVKFTEIFWQQDAGFIMSDELFPTWWTDLPAKRPILTGWLGGPAAGKLSFHPDEALLEKALHSLAAVYELTPAQIKERVTWGRVFNWQKNEFAHGGYSYAMVGSKAARQLISTPLEDTLFFAGEGLYSGPYPGTVEAALASGISAAEKIIACI